MGSVVDEVLLLDCKNLTGKEWHFRDEPQALREARTDATPR